ncbi:hypothetical protein D3C72_2350130 [compost metagenome]
MSLAAFVPINHQPRLLEHAQMPRDHRLRYPGSGRQAPYRDLAFATQAFKQRPPRWIGKRSEDRVLRIRYLGQSMLHWLWIDV